MNTDLASAVELADDVVAACEPMLAKVDVAVFPPFVYLQAVGRTLGHSNVLLGAQDVFHKANGAFTGEISTDMLVDLGVKIVLAGHSERRHVIGESDEMVNQKLRAGLGAGLQVILCVGETMEQRQAGQTDEVNIRQITAGLREVDAEDLRRVVIAYEPVWAIGTGLTATPSDAQAAHVTIRRTVGTLFDAEAAGAIRIQYGGSVNAGNAGELFVQPDIDGGLIGGASLKAGDFAAIVGAAGGKSEKRK